MISVLIPIRGDAPHLELALDSVEAQSDPAIEILVVDDGCSRAVEDELRRRARRDERYRIVKARQEGLIAALNTGLEHASGALLARFDADDWMHPDRLRLQRAAFERQPELDLSATCFHLLDAQPGGGYERYRDWQNALRTGADIRRARFIEAPFAHPTICMRTATLRTCGGYRDLGWPEDYDLFLRLLEQNAVVGKLPEDLHGWRDHPQRTSRIHERYRPEAFLRLKAHFLARGPLRERSSTWIWGAGPTGTRLYRALRAENATIRGFIDIDPRKIGSTRGGLPIHAPAELARHQDVLVIAAVGGAGAHILRAHLIEWGFIEGDHFIAIA